MIAVSLPGHGRFADWRAAARGLIAAEVPPEVVDWRLGGDAAGLFDAPPAPADAPPLKVSAAFVTLAEKVAMHRDPARFARLYALLWRLRTNPGLMGDSADPELRRLTRMGQSVGRDLHQMHAFVRFQELPGAGPRRAFAAWYEPDHYITEAAAPFFTRRFVDMDWTILTPDARAIWEGGRLRFGPGAARPDLPADATADLWTTYFGAIFNPARLNPGAMRAKMPARRWANMPEAQAIPDLIAGAEARLAAMAATGGLAPVARVLPGPEAASLDEARALARDCRRCGLCEMATQTVFGEGDPAARLMVVGEQPGDAEDIAGRPFVGPAGAVLDAALRDAGVARDRLWLTNAVKHFKFTPRGKRRLHQNPDRAEIEHCRWWLDLERRFVAPRLVLGLGGTAARALTGQSARLAARRGVTEATADGMPVRLSWHPAAILRQPDPIRAEAMRAELVDDLRLAARLAAVG